MTATTTRTAPPELLLPRALHRLELAAGPGAVLAVVLFVAALLVAGDEAVALAKHPLSVASSALGLLSLVGLGAGLLRLCVVHPRARGWASAVAGAGVVLAVGAQWSQLVVLPALAHEEPRLAETGLGPVTAGFILSFVLLAVGWLATALRLRGEVPVLLLVVGAVLCVPPLPVRWAVLAVAVTLLARREAAATGD